MVNHFASLLGNVDLRSIDSMTQQYELVFGEDSTLSINDGVLAFGNYTAVVENKLLLPLIDRNYTPLILPRELQRVYDILFPSTSTAYYKQFLLYSYLRVVDLTDKSEEIKNVDRRISYSLDELVDYFKFPNISVSVSTDPDYSLLVYGQGISDENSRNFNTIYDITQQGSSSSVLIYSPTQGVYYHPTKAASKLSTDMDVPVVAGSENPAVSAPITIGSTGLTFVIAGKNVFADTPSKAWRLSVASPVNFKILDKIKSLETYGTAVDDMFKYQQTNCTQTYQNLWSLHYSPAYRLAGLLLAYVERVNLVWQKRAT